MNMKRVKRLLAGAMCAALMLTSVTVNPSIAAAETTADEADLTTPAACLEAGNQVKNQAGTSADHATEDVYQEARELFLKGTEFNETDENKSAIANCWVQVGECTVFLGKGPNNETGKDLQEYVLGCWEKAAELGEGTGYFDLAMAYIGFEIPGAGMGECLEMPHTIEDQRKGVSYLWKAYGLNNGKALRYIGYCYDRGYGVEQSYEIAKYYFDQTRGADLYLAKYKLFGLGGVVQDVSGAVGTLKGTAESTGGNRGEATTARLLLAELLSTGIYTEELNDGTIGVATVEATDQATAERYLNLYKEEYGLSDDEINDIVAGFKTAEDYYNAGNAIKNEAGTSTIYATTERYEAALAQFVLGASMAVTDDNKNAVSNCLVQIGECSVYLGKGPNGETGKALQDYVLGCWKSAGELGNGTGYFDLGLAYIGLEIPGAGMGECLELPHTKADQEKGVGYLQQAKELRNGKALRYIGMCYDGGYGVEQSYEKAYECFSQTNGAELYIAKYKLFGLGGFKQDVAGAVADLTKKAESMQGGNRGEAKTARLLLAELLYTGSYSETLSNGAVGTAAVAALDKATALKYLGYHQDEYGLGDDAIDSILVRFDAKVDKAESQKKIEDLQKQLTAAQSGAQNQTVKIVTNKKKYSVKAKKKVTVLAVASNGGKLTFASKNKKVAKVSKKGVVTGVKKGSTKIVIKTGSTSLEVKVTVK